MRERSVVTERYIYEKELEELAYMIMELQEKMRKHFPIRRDLTMKLNESHDYVENIEKISEGVMSKEYEKAFKEIVKKLKS